MNPSPRVDARWPEVEHRFLVDADEAHRFLDAVRPHLPIAVRDPDQPVEFIRTTYFDTDDLTLFRTNQPATSWRVRIRQYASAPDHRTAPRLGEMCAFEIVEHARALRRKVRTVGSPTEIARILRGDEGGGVRPSRVPPALDYSARAIQLGDLKPRLTTWFRRLGHAAGGVRVTIDQSIEFSQPVGFGIPGDLAAPPAVIGRGPPLVLEVKLRVEPPPWLLLAMQQLFLVTQFSKFRDGLLALRFAEREHLSRSPSGPVQVAGPRPWAGPPP